MRDTEEAQFDEFVRTRSTALLRVAFLLTGHRQTAEDLVQEVLEQMCVRWSRINGTPEAYARKALVNRATNRWRRGRRPEAPLGDLDVELTNELNNTALLPNLNQPGGGFEGWLVPELRRTDEWCSLTGEDRFSDRGALHPVAASADWSIQVHTPNGHYVCLNTHQYGNEVRRPIYGIATADLPAPAARFGGSIAPSSPLAVRLRLPGGQGVIVAAENATLRYRGNDGPWRPVQGYVALLPDSATAVQVIRAGQPTATVELP